EKFLGGVERLRELAPAAVVAACESLQAAAGASTAPEQIDGLLAFIAAHERLPARDEPWYERHMRPPRAGLSALEVLRQAARAPGSGAAVDRRALGRGAEVDRSADVLAPHGPRGRAAARGARGALRRPRRGAARRPRRERLAGARDPQHLLSALSARAARLARPSGSAVGGAPPVPAPAP